MMRSMRVIAASVLSASLLAASCEDETLPDPFVACPDQMPSTGTECPRAGLVCHYFTPCPAYDTASCESDSRWRLTPGCTAGQGGGTSSGAGGTGGAVTASTASNASSSAASGGAGGTGGSGGF